jgi:hypothetical protein
MLQLLQNALSSPAGSFSFVFAIMVLGGWLIYWVTKRVTTIQSDHGTISKSILKIEAHIDESRRDLSYLKGSMDILRQPGIPALVQSHSPISLNQLGASIAEELQVEKVIDRNWNIIFKVLESGVCDKNAYDIQQFILDQIATDPEKFIDKDGLVELKKYAFNKGLPLQYYTPVYGVIIRDKYLKQKGIPIDEIDKHDPTIKKD